MNWGFTSEAWTEHTLIWQGLEPHSKVLLATAHTDEGSHHELFLAFDNLFDGMAGSEQRPSRLCRWNAVHPQARRGGEHGRAHLRVHVWPIGQSRVPTHQDMVFSSGQSALPLPDELLVKKVLSVDLSPGRCVVR